MQKKSFRADDFILQTIEQYSPMVYRLAYSLVKSKYDAEDIHQEVFVRYITKKPDFESSEHEKAWFIRVTTNLCKNWWKTAWKRKVISLTELAEDYGECGETEEGVNAPGGGQHYGMTEESTIVKIVKKLPQKYRVVIHLFYYEELSIEEIARVLDRKPSAVRTQLTRARRKLGELLKEDI